MSKTFEYFKKTGEIIDRNGEWDGDEGFWFSYTVDDKKLEQALLVLVDEYYFDSKVKLKNLQKYIRDCDMKDTLMEMFEEELKDYFEEEALEMYE